MDKERLAQRLMATFVVELEGHVKAFEQGLLALERNPAPPERAEIFAGLFRTAHTLKGASRSVKVDLLAEASHRLEEIFSAARNGQLPINRSFFDYVLPIVDAFGAAGRKLAAGQKVVDGPLLDLLRQEEPVRAAAAEETPAVAPSAAPSAPAPARPASGGHSETARVAGQKLDAMLRQSGELLVVRHRAELRAGEASNLQDILSDWRREWRALEQRVTLLLKENAAAEPNGNSDPAAALRRRNMTELSINRCRDGLWRLDRGFQRFVAGLGSDHRAIEQTAGPLDAAIRRTRMFPFAEACEGLERAVRDLCSGSDKAVDLVIEGADIELDRTVLESIRDPLLHLVRNAVDHGIESKPARRLRGKPETGVDHCGGLARRAGRNQGAGMTAKGWISRRSPRSCRSRVSRAGRSPRADALHIPPGSFDGGGGDGGLRPRGRPGCREDAAHRHPRHGRRRFHGQGRHGFHLGRAADPDFGARDPDRQRR